MPLKNGPALTPPNVLSYLVYVKYCKFMFMEFGGSSTFSMIRAFLESVIIRFLLEWNQQEIHQSKESTFFRYFGSLECNL